MKQSNYTIGNRTSELVAHKDSYITFNTPGQAVIGM